MYVRCPVCGDVYDKDQPWKRTCLGCWKAAKESERPIAVAPWQLRQLEDRALDAESDLREARQELREARAELSRLRNAPPPPPPGLVLDAAMLSKLLLLCHPDRHGGDDPTANEVTRALIEARKAVRQ